MEESVGFLPDVTLGHSGVGLWVYLQQPEESPSWAGRGVGTVVSPQMGAYWDASVSE